MKILVTGGHGFIGTNLVKRIVGRGDDIFSLDNLSGEYCSKEREQIEGVGYVGADILDPQVEEFFKTQQPDIVIHLAAKPGVRPSIEDPFLYTQTNVEGTVRMLEYARKYGVKRFIFASSSSIYGNGHGSISQYAATKRAGEEFCKTYAHLYNMDILCLRFFTVYGDYGRPDMAMHKFTEAVATSTPITQYGDGHTKRDYTHVSDITEGILQAITSSKKFNAECIDLGGGDTIELKDLIALIEKAVGKKAIIEQLPMQPGDVQETKSDILPARMLFGYTPQTSIEEGVQKYVDWHLKNITKNNELSTNKKGR